MNKIWGFIYIMNFRTPPKRSKTSDFESPYGKRINVSYTGTPSQNVFIFGSPQNHAINNEYINKLNDITQISALSYKSGFGFIFFMTDKNNVKKVLKVYFLDPRDRENTESMDYELPNKYINVELAQKLKQQPKPAESGFADDDGYPKRVESTSNFNKEAQIQGEVYEASSSNGPLCPQIYDSYIVENNKSPVFLEGLLKKCGNDDSEAQKMIQYLIDNKGHYDIGCIIMEYAEEYTISSVENSENVIYANLRLLLETGYLHLDLNYGNVMVRGKNDIYLIDFGKSKELKDLVKGDEDRKYFNIIKNIAIKNKYAVEDISSLIECINYFDKYYGVDNWPHNLFQQNFVSNLLKPETSSYTNIANKLNARQNKKIHPYIMNEIRNDSSNSNKNDSMLYSSPPCDKGNNSLGDDENIHPNRMKIDSTTQPRGVSTPPRFLSTPPSYLSTPPSYLSTPPSYLSTPPSYLSTPPSYLSTPPSYISTPSKGLRGGTKRKHKNKSKKTRKNKSNKKRVKLISKK